MAQILVPGVAQASMSGTYGTQPWACVTHWRFGGTTANWSQPNIQLLADTISAAYGANLNKHGNQSVIMNLVTTVDIGSPTPVVGSNTTPHTGTVAGGLGLTSGTCAVMSFRIPSRYRGGHPRMYLPLGTITDSATEYSWTALFQQTLATDFAAFITQIVNALPGTGSTAGQHCIVRYTYQYTDDPIKKKYTKTRTAVQGVYTVQSYQTNPTFGSQRRRLTTG